MKTYLVTWQIEVDAENPYHAARLAQEIQQDRTSIANFYTIGEKPRSVDLQEHPDTDEHLAACRACMMAHDKGLPDGDL